MTKTNLACLLIFLFSMFFFSFRLMETPRGITIDEAAFGYNAGLISKTLRDENGRFLPVFVLSLDGRDWRQPVTQYMQVIMFKIFGRSLFNLKFVSVLTVSFSAVLVYLLGSQIFGRKFGLLSLVFFLTVPVVMIHSHLALDNISVLPFILIWLIGLWNFKEKKSLKYLILSGISLGIGFYAHKSMRSAVPVWTILTVLYLLSQIKNWKQFTLPMYKPLIVFLVSISPFYLISPILNYKYAGAVFGTDAVGISSVFSFFEFYLSNFDLSFLFIKGDKILHHSTGIHGMFLLASLPVFIYGIYKSLREKNLYFIFLTCCFVAGPLLLGFVGSVHRASRIIFLVPAFALISAYGALKLFEFKNRITKSATAIFVLIFVANFLHFINYYWFSYPKDTYHIFYSPVGMEAYKKLDQISREKNLTPLISYNLNGTTGDGGAVENFSRSIYFINPTVLKEKSRLPEKSILLTQDKNYEEGQRMSAGAENYFLYIKD